MRLCSPLLLCLAAVLSSAYVITHPHHHHHHHEDDSIWTKLILTHHWPNTFCSMEHCKPNISYWTLHGLWPDKGIDCNSSWHFNSSKIEDLLPDMRKSWPDLLKPTSSEFWKYEWHKHGTCAAKADSLNSQHKYFSKALELYHKVDLDRVLKKYNITPSEDYYKLSQIEDAIEKSYNAKPKIQCVHQSRRDDVQVLGQIEICFGSDFTLLDCERHFAIDTNGNDLMDVDRPSGFSVCQHDVPVYYPPLAKRNNHTK
ncbi:ribonuclease T2 [Notolabrus celidotus]|uniref:ribonuclease T2 n=1 Tax=Notolabrus celidotus TaxID=1203425 RepID=UPI00148FE798|nr:ribonuclease T2 [Notolabrus celidotus]